MWIKLRGIYHLRVLIKMLVMVQVLVQANSWSLEKEKEAAQENLDEPKFQEISFQKKFSRKYI